MDTIIDFKSSISGLDIEFEINPLPDNGSGAEVDERLSELQKMIAKMDSDIDRLTNHADGLDYIIAVTSGIITGIIDATIVGEWNFAEAKKDAYRDTNSKVVEFAKKQPDYYTYCQFALEGKGTARRKPKDPDRLESAIDFLEWKFHLPGDGAYRSGSFGIDGKTHRIDDLCHHPTLVGLICCIIVQFTGNTLYINKHGEDINIPVTVNEYGNFVGNNTVTKLFSGVINWFITCAKTMANRKGHLMSDIATSASLPGSFLSTITELASIPCFRNEDFLIKLRDAYKNGIGTGSGQIDLGAFNVLFEGAQNKLDVTTENAVAHELKRQVMPVVINEVLVRASYFIRRMIQELREKRDVTLIEWKKIIPFNNRTIVRMMTIATGTFTSIDMADAAVNAVSKSVDTSSFFSNMLLRVNFVGVGRFAIAISVDLSMGVSKSILTSKRIRLQQEQLLLLDAKVYYKHKGMWEAAESAGETIERAYSIAKQSADTFARSVRDINNSLINIGEHTSAIESKNAGLIDDITDILAWG